MIGQTLIEKILSTRTGRRVHAGEIVVADVDRILVHDGTARRVFQRFPLIDVERLANAAKTTLYLDHAAPPSTAEIGAHQAELVREAIAAGIAISPVGAGISHQCMLEDQALPGELILGADSHTCTVGAVGAVGLGMGSTDVAVAIAYGETWLRVPETIEVQLRGRLDAGVDVKDLMLQLVGKLGASGADYRVLEFQGEGVGNLTVPERAVLTNLSAEVGAKTGLVAVDDVTREWYAARGRSLGEETCTADEGASYDRRLKIDLAALEPMVARPGRHDDDARVSELGPVRVDQVFIGSCTNGHARDFRLAAEVLDGRRIAVHTRLLLVPASHRVLEEILADGSAASLVASGGVLLPPGCGPCVGIHQGTLAAGQVCVATQSRNFAGRMGDRGSEVYLASAATAAATALRGEITDPREVLRGA